jgi:hypothetical protein
LLRELDDPEWLEWPQHYDHGESTVYFDVLVARLEGDLAACCTAEQDTQDSSGCGRVVVPADAPAFARNDLLLTPRITGVLRAYYEET